MLVDATDLHLVAEATGQRLKKAATVFYAIASGPDRGGDAAGRGDPG